MTRLLLLCCLTACADPVVVAAPILTSPQRIQVAVDSLNAAIAAWYAEGGRIELQLLYPDAYPPDPTLPPLVAIFVRP